MVFARAAAGSANPPLSLDQVMHSERDRRHASSRRHPALSRSHAAGAQADIWQARATAAPLGLSRIEAPCAAAHAGHLPPGAGGHGNKSVAADSLLRGRVIVKVSLKVRAGGEAGEGGGAARVTDEAGRLVTVHRRLSIPLEFDAERVPIKGWVHER